MLSTILERISKNKSKECEKLVKVGYEGLVKTQKLLAWYISQSKSGLLAKFKPELVFL